jgi:hypothetical protein
VISVIEEADSAVSEAETELKSEGFGDAFLVTPVGHAAPRAPEPDRRRSAA